MAQGFSTLASTRTPREGVRRCHVWVWGSCRALGFQGPRTCLVLMPRGRQQGCIPLSTRQTLLQSLPQNPQRPWYLGKGSERIYTYLFMGPGCAFWARVKKFFRFFLVLILDPAIKRAVHESLASVISWPVLKVPEKLFGNARSSLEMSDYFAVIFLFPSLQLTVAYYCNFKWKKLSTSKTVVNFLLRGYKYMSGINDLPPRYMQLNERE